MTTTLKRHSSKTMTDLYPKVIQVNSTEVVNSKLNIKTLTQIFFSTNHYQNLHFIFETLSEKLYDAQCRKRALMQFVDNAGPDQPAHLRSLIWAFVVRLQNQWIL